MSLNSKVVVAIKDEEDDDVVMKDSDDPLKKYKVFFAIFFDTLSKLEQEGNFEAYNHLLKKFEMRITPRSGEAFVENIKTLKIGSRNIGNEIDRIRNFDGTEEFHQILRLIYSGTEKK